MGYWRSPAPALFYARVETTKGTFTLEIERRLAHIEEPLHLSIMGCAVNGPGEAHDSQLGITFGRGVGMIFKDGVPMRKVAGEDIVEAFVLETEKLLEELKKQPQI